MVSANGFFGAENGLQHLQKPRCLLPGIDGILNMLGKISKQIHDIVDIVGNGIALVSGLHNAPVDPDVVQGVGQAGGLQPIVKGGGLPVLV